MASRNLLLLCLAICFTSFHAFAVPIEPGDYVEGDFLEALTFSQSPLRALGDYGHGPQVITVFQEGQDFRFVAHANWHEGWTLFTLHGDGRMERGMQPIDYPKPAFFAPRRFRFRDPDQDSISHEYVYVGDADLFVAQIALGGTYADQNQHEITFGADGILRGMGPPAPYSLDNDHATGNDFDFFYVGSEKKKAIAFQHHGGHLILYPIHILDAGNSIGEPDFKHPLLKLHRLARK